MMIQQIYAPKGMDCSPLSDPSSIGWAPYEVPADCGPLQLTVSGLPSWAHVQFVGPNPVPVGQTTYINVNVDNNKSLVGSMWTYTVTAQQLGSGSDCYTSPYTYGTWTNTVICSTASGFEGSCPILQVTDEDTKKVVSGTPPSETDWVVGLQKNLKASTQPGSGSGTYSAVQTVWSPPPNVVASFAFGGAKTTAPKPLAKTTNPSIQFYWTAGNNSSPAQFSVGQEVTRSDGKETAVTNSAISYVAHTPANVSIGASYSPTQLGPYDKLGTKAVSSGTQLDLPTSAGIDIDFKATSPDSFVGYAGGGDFAASQVIASSKDEPGNFPLADACSLFTTDQSGADGSARNLFVGKNQSVVYRAIDAPASFALPAVSMAGKFGDAFIDYFLYRPSGTKSIWVSLGNLTWSWGATVTNKNGTYVKSNVVNSNSATASYVTQEPTWNGTTVSNLTCHPLPAS